MSVLALLIKYLFIVFILVAFFVIGVVAYFLHRVRNAARRFANGGMGGQGGMNNGMGGGRSSAANNGTYGSASSSSSSSSTSSSANNTGSAGNAAGSSRPISGDIYDSRSPREANRKIFAKDEGEYVDFVEE